MSVSLVLLIEALLFSAFLFGAAGTLRWPAAWVFLILFFACAIRTTVMLARHAPALLKERMRPPVQKEQPRDKVFLAFMTIAWCGWFVLMGLDAVRFGWSRMPLRLQCVG